MSIPWPCMASSEGYHVEAPVNDGGSNAGHQEYGAAFDEESHGNHPIGFRGGLHPRDYQQVKILLPLLLK